MIRSRLLLLAGCALAVAACSVIENATTPTSPPEITTLAPVTTSEPTATTAARPAPTMPAAAPAGLCESYADPQGVGVVAIEAVTETSGIAASRHHPGTIWMHNDSGGGPYLYAADLSGTDLGTFEVDAPSFDWEDMAIGPGPDPVIDYLYLGDIGDNLHFRPAVTVHRVPEPVPNPAGGFLADVASFNLIYPEPGYDSEAMMVDPVTGDILLVTKGSSGDPALIYRADSEQLVDGANVQLALVGTFNLEPGAFVTAADINVTGSTIVFRGYNQVWLWERIDLDFSETFAAEPCRTPSTAEIQGEAITFAGGGYSYVTISEGRSPDINVVASGFDP